jgi:hypothetical protein
MADGQVSEFANNDLEKYSKALDNAILKYHSIKMDEINDNIGHLWSKTYQGTGALSLFFHPLTTPIGVTPRVETNDRYRRNEDRIRSR